MKAKPLFILIIVISIFTNPLDSFSQNNCLTFDGSDDYVQCNNRIYSTGNITIEAWIYPTDFKAGSYLNTIIGTDNWQSVDAEGYVFRYGGAAGDLDFTFAYGSGIRWNSKVANNVLTQNTWQHVAVSYDQNVIKMYVNGKEVLSESLSLEINPSSQNARIGDSPGDPGNRLIKGSIDELRVWSDIRSEAEIRQNMYQELSDPASETNLLAYYQFNETNSTTLNDETSNNYNGTLTNMTGEEFSASNAMFGPRNCLDFDGEDDYVAISNLNPGGLGSITIESWVYFDTFNDGVDSNISNVIRSGNENVCLRIGDGGLDANMPQFVVTVAGQGQSKVNANARLDASKWYHIACVYDGSEMIIYINGLLDNSGALSGNIAATSEDLLLGANPGTPLTREMDGRLDEIRIWSDARTVTEIRENMCKSLHGNEANLLAYFNADDLSSGLTDFSGSNYDGTISNAVQIPSSAFNTWLNTSSASWSTNNNWSRTSTPASYENIGVYSYSGGTNVSVSGSPTVDNFVLGASSSLSLSSAITINGNLILESDLNLNGQTITLGPNAMLIEDAGRIYGSSGSITTTRTLSDIDENVAGLGAEITTSANMGSTTITRSHAPNSSPSSIKRIFDISPTNNSSLNATLVFHYNDNELNGLTESYLKLIKSADGNEWGSGQGTVNTFNKAITLTGIDGFSKWTAAMTGEETPPVLDTDDPSHTYVPGDAAITVASNTTVTADGSLERATISLTPIVAEDLLSVSGLPGGLSAEWDNNTKILAISGTGSASDYQTALRNVKFETTSESVGLRTIDFILGSGVGLLIDGNQHFYEIVDNGSAITWTAARTAALNSRFGGAQGYLATISSETENNYIIGKMEDNSWIGASDEETEDVWKWMDGPEGGTQFWQGDAGGSVVGGQYNNWVSGEPNDSYESYGEDYAHLYGNGENRGQWNDYYVDFGVRYYIVEYGGDGSSFTIIDDASINVITDLEWDGSESTEWNTAANWNHNIVPGASHNITIPDVANDPIISATTAAEMNDLVIQTGASLTIESTATNNGSLIVNGTSSGTITYDRYLLGNKWHLVSSPVGSQDLYDFVTEGNDIATYEGKYGIAPYNNSVPGWGHFLTGSIIEDGNFIDGKGYEMMAGSTGTVSFTGTVATGNVSIGITSPASPGNPWNLVGNPYPSALFGNNPAAGTNNFMSVNTADLEDSHEAIYIWDAAADVYRTINHSSGATYIAPGQAFFIYSVSGGGTVEFTENMQTHQTGNIFKSSADGIPAIRLIAQKGSEKSSTSIKFIEGTTTGLDPGYDAGRFSGGSNSFAVYTHLVGDESNTVDFDIQCLPPDEYEHVIPVGLNAPANSEISFSAEIENLPGDVPVILEDRDAKVFTPLQDEGSTYLLSLSAAVEGTGRFFIHTGRSSGVDIVSLEEIRLIPDPRNNYIRILGDIKTKTLISVYDLGGRRLKHAELEYGNENELQMDAIHSGVYIIVLSTPKETTGRKLSWIR